MYKYNKVTRYYHTIKYLRPVQIYSRVKYIYKQWMYRTVPQLTKRLVFSDGIGVELRDSFFLSNVPNEILNDDDKFQWLKSADEIVKGNFTFLNHTEIFDSLEHIDWNNSELPQLWRFHLHYFDYAWDLGTAYVVSGQDIYYRSFKTIVLSWMQNNEIGFGDGWHPYTISLRITNLIYSYHLFKKALYEDFTFKKDLLNHIFSMAKFLAYNLEYHILGNHLLENSKALVFAGLFFGGTQGDELFQTGTNILWNQAVEQVLDDGGHFELSPMYHTIVLWDYLECINLLNMNKRPVPSEVVKRIKKMLSFQREILHPDGNNPLFNDTALDSGPKPLDVLHFGSIVLGQYYGSTENISSKLQFILGNKCSVQSLDKKPVELKTLVALNDTGYFIMRSRKINSHMVIDCGKIGPDYLPGHAHADILNYELSIYRERFIVDSGIFEYRKGKYREYFRSTRAHNTVTVNDQNQSDVWESFRVGQRGNPLVSEIFEKPKALVFHGSHDSYLSRYGIVHSRYIAQVDNSIWVVIDELTHVDRVKKVQMEPTHKYSNYIHFHPQVEFETTEKNMINLKLENRTIQVVPFGIKNPRKEIICSKDPVFSYSSKFGKFQPKLTLKLCSTFHKDFVFGYVISPVSQEVRIERVELNHIDQDNYSLILRFTGNTWEYKKSNGDIEILEI